MTKLKTLRPCAATLKPMLHVAPGSPATRPVRSNDTPYRKWYKTARWQKLRWSVLVRDHVTCQMCGRLQADTSKLVCDHVERHNGSEAAFWAGPFQTLCADPCHNTHKQKLENGSESRAIGLDGWPV